MLAGFSDPGDYATMDRFGLSTARWISKLDPGNDSLISLDIFPVSDVLLSPTPRMFGPRFLAPLGLLLTGSPGTMGKIRTEHLWTQTYV